MLSITAPRRFFGNSDIHISLGIFYLGFNLLHYTGLSATNEHLRIVPLRIRWEVDLFDDQGFCCTDCPYTYTQA